MEAFHTAFATEMSRLCVTQPVGRLGYLFSPKQWEYPIQPIFHCILYVDRLDQTFHSLCGSCRPTFLCFAFLSSRLQSCPQFQLLSLEYSLTNHRPGDKSCMQTQDMVYFRIVRPDGVRIRWPPPCSFCLLWQPPNRWNTNSSCIRCFPEGQNPEMIQLGQEN